MSVLDYLIGRPLPTSDERAEQIGVAAGIPIFGLDALSSAAYGPEAALTLLIPLSLVGLHYILPITACIIALLVIVFFSYRQTIAAYPNGGGSYTVARHNLGSSAGLLAAAALLTDYILTVAVGISAGVGALVSAIPRLQSHTLALCLAILVLITLINLRGLREAGIIFMVPTYLFLGTLLITIVVGIFEAIVAGGHPAPRVAPPAPPPAILEYAGIWFLLKVFSSGCTALTGVEAVSNGVKAFRESAVKTAQITLSIIITFLGILLAGISYLVRAYHIVATVPGAPGYQSILSMLVAAVFGKGLFYYLTMFSILLVLSLSANTAFADFPRLCRSIALNNYLPRSLAFRGRRLVYTEGILLLAFFAACLLLLFDGVTDRLIPLYAVGAFLAFTLSQFGMVVHWKKVRGPHALRHALVNGFGGLVTGITVLVVLVAKFKEGAWITVLFIPSILLFFRWVRRQYHAMKVEAFCTRPAKPAVVDLAPIAVVPADRWSKVLRSAIEFASALSPQIIGVHIRADEHSELLHENWQRYVVAPFEEAKVKAPQLVQLRSPYRYVVTPFVDYVVDLAEKNPDRRVIVVIPEVIETQWFKYILHNQRGRLLEQMLLARGNDRIFTLTAPYYMSRRRHRHAAIDYK